MKLEVSGIIDLWQLKAWPFVLSATGQTPKPHCHISILMWKSSNTCFLAGFVWAKYLCSYSIFFSGVSYWIKAVVCPRDGCYFCQDLKHHYLLLWKDLTNTLISTLVFGELLIRGLFEQCQVFMNNTCIHFECKVLSGMFPKHKTCQNDLSIFTESPASVLRSEALLLPCTLFAQWSLPGQKYQWSKEVVQALGYPQSMGRTKWLFKQEELYVLWAKFRNYISCIPLEANKCHLKMDGYLTPLGVVLSLSIFQCSVSI